MFSSGRLPADDDDDEHHNMHYDYDKNLIIFFNAKAN